MPASIMARRIDLQQVVDGSWDALAAQFLCVGTDRGNRPWEPTVDTLEGAVS